MSFLICWLTLLAILLSPAAAATDDGRSAATQTATTQSADAPTRQSDSESVPASAPGADQPDDESESSTNQAATPRQIMIERLNRAASPTDRARAALAIARHILVEEVQRPLSLELARMNSDSAALAGSVKEGLRYLADAEKALKELPRGDADRSELEEYVELLTAFGGVFGSLAGAPAETDSSELLEKASDLAIYLDDPRPGVVQAARLWLGVAYRRAGRPERALQVLGLAITNPKHASIGFWSRVQSVQALADRGQCVAATSVAMRLKSRIDTWFAEDAESRRQAHASLRPVFQAIERQWRKQPPGAAASNAPSSMPVDLFTRESDRVDDNEILLLRETIPGLPRWDESDPARPNAKATASTQPDNAPEKPPTDDPPSDESPSDPPP